MRNQLFGVNPIDPIVLSGVRRGERLAVEKGLLTVALTYGLAPIRNVRTGSLRRVIAPLSWWSCLTRCVRLFGFYA